jgi:endonuclease YncB( thermonuclease family)
MATIITAILLALISAQVPPAGNGTIEIIGPVRVIDGDTLEIFIDGHQTAIGIIGIKAPRANGPCGVRAAQLLQQLVSTVNGRQTPVTLRFEEDAVVSLDVRHRRMYHLRLADGRSAAQILVASGLAEPDGTGEESVALDLAKRQALTCGS